MTALLLEHLYWFWLESRKGERIPEHRTVQTHVEFGGGLVSKLGSYYRWTLI